MFGFGRVCQVSEGPGSENGWGLVEQSAGPVNSVLRSFGALIGREGDARRSLETPAAMLLQSHRPPHLFDVPT